MKRVYLILAFVGLVSFAKAQFILTYEKQALQPDYTNVTQEINDIDAGGSGAGRIWDFTKLVCSKSKSSNLVQTSSLPNGNLIEKANLAVVDERNSFYFDVNQNGIFYYGQSNAESNIQFYSPIKKMVYPFKYGDHYDGKFAGEGLHYQTVQTQITGTYSLDGDAFGTILLPDNITLKNAMRIKTTEKIIEAGCKATEVMHTKYLWFIKESRYPILVIALSEQYVDGELKTTQNAYYNAKAVNDYLANQQTVISKLSNNDFLFNANPNPFNEEVNITYNLKQQCDVSIEILDINGAKIRDITKSEKQTGEQNYTLNGTQIGLAVGTYFVKMTVNSEVFIKKLVRVQ